MKKQADKNRFTLLIMASANWHPSTNKIFEKSLKNIIFVATIAKHNTSVNYEKIITIAFGCLLLFNRFLRDVLGNKDC